MDSERLATALNVGNGRATESNCGGQPLLGEMPAPSGCSDSSPQRPVKLPPAPAQHRVILPPTASGVNNPNSLCYNLFSMTLSIDIPSIYPGTRRRSGQPSRRRRLMARRGGITTTRDVRKRYWPRRCKGFGTGKSYIGATPSGMRNGWKNGLPVNMVASHGPAGPDRNAEPGTSTTSSTAAAAEP